MNTEIERNEVRVWDPLVRLFHWTLVISFAVAYLSGEDLLQVHLYAGYLVTGLLVFRLIWGFIGSRHARFSDFLYSPRAVMGYLKSLFSGHPKRYLGHNPAGGVMILLLLVSLTGTVATGLAMDPALVSGGEVTDMQESTAGRGWLQDDDDDEDEDDDEEGEYAGKKGEENESMEDLHEFFANFTLFLVFVHIAGVVVSSRLHRENLVRAMITGKKPADPEA